MTSKSTINLRFNKAAETYDSVSFVHQEIAHHLLHAINSCLADRSILPPKNILDVGAGTGILANAVHDSLSDVHVTLTDISANMLDIAMKKYHGKFDYIVANAEHFENYHKYDTIVSAMAMQWFHDVKKFLSKIVSESRTIAFAMPIFGTFSEWYELLESFDANVKYPKYKTHEEMLEMCREVAYIKHSNVQKYFVKFQSPLECARYINNLGVNIGGLPYNLESMKNFFSLNRKVTLCYDVFFSVLTKK